MNFTHVAEGDSTAALEWAQRPSNGEPELPGYQCLEMIRYGSAPTMISSLLAAAKNERHWSAVAVTPGLEASGLSAGNWPATWLGLYYGCTFRAITRKRLYYQF